MLLILVSKNNLNAHFIYYARDYVYNLAHTFFNFLIEVKFI